MKLDTHQVEFFMYIPVLVVMQEIDSALSLEGGPCISFAQKMCHKEGTELWVADYDRQVNGICRLFGLYQSCMVTHMSKCAYKSHEKDLHQSDIVHHFVSPPYNCPFPAQNLGQRGGKANMSQRSHSCTYTYSLLLLTIGIFIEIVGMIFTLNS